MNVLSGTLLAGSSTMPNRGVRGIPMMEPLLIGWEQVAEALHLHPKRANKKREYLLSQGLIFYRAIREPGQKSPHKRVCSYESVIKAHLMKNGGL